MMKSTSKRSGVIKMPLKTAKAVLSMLKSLIAKFEQIGSMTDDKVAMKTTMKQLGCRKTSPLLKQQWRKSHQIHRAILGSTI